MINITWVNCAFRALIGWFGTEKQVIFTSEQPIRQNRLSRVKFSTFFRCIKEINYLRYRLKQLVTSTPVKNCYLFSITEHYPQMQSTIE